MKSETDKQSHIANSQQGAKPVTAVTTALPAILKQVKENSLSILNNQLTEFFVSCDDLFFDLASKAETNQKQNDLFETMRDIRLHKKECLTQFKLELDNLFSQLSTNQQAKPTQSLDSRPKPTFEGLGLVSEDEMEKNVALSSVITKARGECQESLYHLTIRFDYLIHSMEITESNNPLDPAQICEAFCKATDPIDLTLQNRIIFLKQFDLIVGRNLFKITNLANELLVNAGVLPQIKPKSQNRAPQQPKGLQPPPQSSQQEKRQLPQGSRQQGASNRGDNQQHHSHQRASDQSASDSYSADNGSGGYSPTDAYTARDENSYIQDVSARVTPGYTELSQLISTFQTSGQTNPRFISRAQFSGPPINQDSLIQGLTYAQAQQPFDVNSTRNYIRDIVESILLPNEHNKESHSLDEPDENVINLVAMFFDFVLSDKALPVAVQAQIGRLQIPILKIALKDKSFFEDKKHPARTLINTLGEASLGLTADDPDKQDVLFSLIQTIVQEIHDSCDGDLEVFRKQLQVLESKLSSEKKRAQVIERRTSEAAIGQAKTENARRAVHVTISERIKDSELPPYVTDFLVKHWHKFLLSNHLRHGDKSPEWLDAVQVIDDLLWVIQSHDDNKSQLRAKKLAPQLKERIYAGIKKANAENEEWNNLSPGLFGILQLASEGRSAEIRHTQLSSAQKTTLGISEPTHDKPWQDMSGLERQQAKQSALRFESIQAAEHLTVGAWAVLSEPGLKSIRCKLSAKIMENDTYVFVNRFGIKALEKNKKDIAMSIQKKHLTILESGPLFERAVNRIATSLRKTESAAN
ncbi:MAG: hypothetical protein COA99_01885 [Moraxellaceae bacterium]|nr:MAG: hypothetical protein COA99_01885 [Moraxellaceae bacterium]